MLFWIWLAEALGAGNRDFGRLIALYETPYEIFLAEEAEIERIPEISPRTVRALADKSLQRATEILDTCEKQGIGILPYGDERYPESFADLKDPPVLLYCSGSFPNLSKRLSIGMVGTRKMSEYGLRSAYKIAYELASAGVVIVSGMAAGIDGVCAAGAIAAKCETVAVLGCGVDVVYPKHHKRLRDAILKKGAVVSEYPPGTRPTSYHFPTRNRLIAALSQGTVVVEAGMGSGSLITAKVAVTLGKEVFALPANVGSTGAEGTNGLLRDGAHPILGSEDVLAPYQYAYAEMIRPEAIAKLGNASLVNLQYLNDLGVIELASAPKTSPVKETHGEAQPKPKRSSRGRPIGQESEKTARDQAEGKRLPEKESVSHAVSNETMSSLSPVQFAVMQAIPDDRGITADALSALEYPYQEVISALTMLEIMGLVQKLPGAIYVKI